MFRENSLPVGAPGANGAISRNRYQVIVLGESRRTDRGRLSGSDLFEQWRRLMDDWAAYLAQGASLDAARSRRR